jgi:signal transduction histidine kinase
VGVLGSDRSSLERFVTSGIDEATREAIGELPRGRGILGVLIDQPLPLRLVDVGAHPRSFGFPLGHPAMRSFLGVPVVIRGEAWGNLYLTEKQGGEFSEADEQAVGVLADWAATAVENARLYRDEHERRGAAERAVAALEASTEIARAVGGETRLERVLELIVKRARALVEARSMVMLLVDGDELVVAAAAGHVAESLVGMRVPIEGSTSGAVLAHRRSQRLADVRVRLRFGLADVIDAQAGLLVPLVFHGRAVGVLEAFDRLGGGPEFSSEDERLLLAFAASAATAVATAQDVARQSLRRSIEAADQERARWARELHDETLQELAALKLALAYAARSGDETVLGQVVADATAQIDASIRGLRRMISDLRPATLDALGTAAALESLAERTRARARLDIRLEVDLDHEAGRHPTRHSAQIEDTIYRVVQESLTNVAKHANATTVTVTVREFDEAVVVEIGDDGDGFDPELRAGGYGLIGIRERVALAGGTFSLTTSPGQGARLTMSLPAERRHDQPTRTRRLAGHAE